MNEALIIQVALSTLFCMVCVHYKVDFAKSIVNSIVVIVFSRSRMELICTPPIVVHIVSGKRENANSACTHELHRQIVAFGIITSHLTLLKISNLFRCHNLLLG